MQDLTQMSNEELGALSGQISKELQVRANEENKRQAVALLEDFSSRLNVKGFFERAQLRLSVREPADVSNYMRPQLAWRERSVLGTYLRDIIAERPHQHLLIEVRDLGGLVYFRITDRVDPPGSHDMAAQFKTDSTAGRYVLHYTPPLQKSAFELAQDELPMQYVDTREVIRLELAADYTIAKQYVTETQPVPLS